MMQRIVTLLTDFGTSDGFVGAMKGVILSLCPTAQVVDLTHEIPPQDVVAGAWALREATATFPPATIHVAVVDPGVGTTRRPILVEHEQTFFVGPDNGLLSLAAPRGSAFLLDRSELHAPKVSSTFHGRDVFAPVAGHLASGRSPRDCGTPFPSGDRVRIEWPAATRGHGQIVGQVVHVDHFGNLVTNMTRDDLAGEEWVVTLASLDVGPVRSTFGDVKRGEWVAYMGSNGYLEIAIREGNASMCHSTNAPIICKNRKITR